MRPAGGKKVVYYWALYLDGNLIRLDHPIKAYSAQQACACYVAKRGIPWSDVKNRLSGENLGDNWKMACSRFQRLSPKKQKPMVSKKPKEVWVQAEISFGQEIYDY